MSSLARPKGQSISSVSSASAVIEASAADLVLLKQSLGKSEKLSSKLGSMLTGFDDVSRDHAFAQRRRQVACADVCS